MTCCNRKVKGRRELHSHPITTLCAGPTSLATGRKARGDAALLALENDPRPYGCLKMTASSEWRLRIGAYRIRYLIDDAGQAITVTHIGHRRDVYNS